MYTVGDGVSAPTLLHKVEPEYTEEARLAKYQGTVLLSVVIDPNGTATNIKVVHSPGLGLDEKAIEAVQKWTFRPGFKDDKPVKVGAIVEVRLPATPREDIGPGRTVRSQRQRGCKASAISSNPTCTV